MKRRSIVYVVGFLSGMCALVYEIVWMRIFFPVFGLSVYSTTTVLCAFMGGLGLGSWLAPAVVRRWRGSPWRLYSLLEIGIGLGSLLVPFLAGPITSLYVGVSHVDSSGAFTGVVRFLASFAAMLPPTFFMGLTLPVLVHACRGAADGEALASRRIGFLYGYNTVGGATGCILVGFVLLYTLGIVATVLVTAAINFSLALFVYVLFGRARFVSTADEVGAAAGDAEPPSAVAAGPGRVHPAVVLALYGVIGVTSFGYELSWFRILIFYLQSATYSFSIMLTLFLLGLGAGSVIYSSVIEKRLRGGGSTRTAMYLAVAQVLIALCGVGTIHVFNRLYTVWRAMVSSIGADSWLMIEAQKFLVAGCVILPPTLLMGLTFPLLARLYKQSGAGDARTVGHLYATNTAGAIVGSLVTGFVLFDLLGVQTTLTVLSVLSLMVGGIFALGPLRRVARYRVAFGSLAALVICIAAFTSDRLLVRQFASFAAGTIIYYDESASDITYVVERDLDKHRELRFNDGRGTSSTLPVSNYVNRLLAYSSMAMKPDAKDVLVICMGCGNTASAFAKFPIERLDIVDISPGAFDAAEYFFTNDHVLEDPRVHTHVEDGRNFLLRTERLYDVIEIELPSIHADGVVNLYTREFYEIARSRLKPGGIISQWVDALQARREVSYMLLNTMREVFPHSVVWASKWAWWMNGVNTSDPARIDYAAASRLFAEPAVLQDMGEVGSSFEDVLAKVVAAGDRLDSALAGATVVTDDHTLVDFLLPKIDSPYARGGGVAHMGSPLRGVFVKSWKERGTAQAEKLDMTPFYAESFEEQVDASLREVTPGFPDDVRERVLAANGVVW